VLVAVLPLALTSILAEALMVQLDIGVKVATLPVVALGVGIGVDYALYLLTVQLAMQRRGMSLGQAYRQAVAFTRRGSHTRVRRLLPSGRRPCHIAPGSGRL
jgi:predicted RND superfamily exporter protein